MLPDEPFPWTRYTTKNIAKKKTKEMKFRRFWFKEPRVISASFRENVSAAKKCCPYRGPGPFARDT